MNTRHNPVNIFTQSLLVTKFNLNLIGVLLFICPWGHLQRRWNIYILFVYVDTSQDGDLLRRCRGRKLSIPYCQGNENSFHLSTKNIGLILELRMNDSRILQQFIESLVLVLELLYIVIYFKFFICIIFFGELLEYFIKIVFFILIVRFYSFSAIDIGNWSSL